MYKINIKKPLMILIIILAGIFMAVKNEAIELEINSEIDYLIIENNDKKLVHISVSDYKEKFEDKNSDYYKYFNNQKYVNIVYLVKSESDIKEYKAYEVKEYFVNKGINISKTDEEILGEITPKLYKDLGEINKLSFKDNKPVFESIFGSKLNGAILKNGENIVKVGYKDQQGKNNNLLVYVYKDKILSIKYENTDLVFGYEITTNYENEKNEKYNEKDIEKIKDYFIERDNLKHMNSGSVVLDNIVFLGNDEQTETIEFNIDHSNRKLIETYMDLEDVKGISSMQIRPNSGNSKYIFNKASLEKVDNLDIYIIKFDGKIHHDLAEKDSETYYETYLKIKKLSDGENILKDGNNELKILAKDGKVLEVKNDSGKLKVLPENFETIVFKDNYGIQISKKMKAEIKKIIEGQSTEEQPNETVSLKNGKNIVKVRDKTMTVRVDYDDITYIVGEDLFLITENVNDEEILTNDSGEEYDSQSVGKIKEKLKKQEENKKNKKIMISNEFYVGSLNFYKEGEDKPIFLNVKGLETIRTNLVLDETFNINNIELNRNGGNAEIESEGGLITNLGNDKYRVELDFEAKNQGQHTNDMKIIFFIDNSNQFETETIGFHGINSPDSPSILKIEVSYKDSKIESISKIDETEFVKLEEILEEILEKDVKTINYIFKDEKGNLLGLEKDMFSEIKKIIEGQNTEEEQIKINIGGEEKILEKNKNKEYSLTLDMTADLPTKINYIKLGDEKLDLKESRLYFENFEVENFSDDLEEYDYVVLPFIPSVDGNNKYAGIGFLEELDENSNRRNNFAINKKDSFDIIDGVRNIEYRLEIEGHSIYIDIKFNNSQFTHKLDDDNSNNNGEIVIIKPYDPAFSNLEELKLKNI